jgi:tetratricopeptide (TPR) repeat protein
MYYSPFGGPVGGTFRLSGRTRVQVWDLRAGFWGPRPGPLFEVEVKALRPTLALADGARLLAVGTSKDITVYDPHAGKEVAVLRGHEGAVVDLAFDRAGVLLASASEDGTTRLWHARTGRELAAFDNGPKTVTRVALSPTGRWLATGDFDGRVRLRDLFEVRRDLRAAGLDWSPEAVPAGPAPQAAGHLDAARGHHRGGRYAEAVADYGRALALDPASAAAYRGRAAARYHLKQYAEAVADFQKAGELAPDQAPNALLYEALFQLGLAQHASGQWQQAVDLMGRALTVAPQNAQAWIGRGNALCGMGRADRALDDFNRAVELRQDWWYAWACRGGGHAMLGHWEQAAADLDQAVRRGADADWAWRQHALLRLQAGDVAGYRAACVQILKRFGKTSDPSVADGVAWACVLAPDAVADYALPLRLAEQALAADRKNAGYQRTVGALLFRAGKAEDAVRRLEESVNRADAGGGADAWFFLAMAHHRLGHAAEARQWFAKGAARMEQASRKPSAGAAGARVEWETQLANRLLHREAEALLKPEKP